MSHLPSFDQFKALAGPHRLVPVYRQLVSDSLTPVGAYTLLPDSDYSFLFESVVGAVMVVVVARAVHVVLGGTIIIIT